MRVLIDLTSLADNFSGIERYAACLSLEMIKDFSMDFVLVFKREVHKLFESAMNQNNVEIIILKSANKLFFNQIRLPNAIRKIKADYYLFLAFPVPVLLFKRNMVSTIHDICCWDCPETMNGMSKWYFRFSHRIAILKCKRIITISEFSKERIIERLKVKSEKIWLVFCGVDQKFLNYVSSEIENKKVREKYNLPQKYLLSLSTLEPRKNLNLLIDAYTQLVVNKGLDIPLVLAGRKGWKMDKVLSSIDEKVRDKILFTGFVDDVDLPSIYANSVLFVFPSKYEGFGMPPLEAVSCGAKVLSSDSTSLPEVLGDNAKYFRNDDIMDLTLKIYCELKKNTKGVNHYKDLYNWKQNAMRLKNYLNGELDNE